MSPRAPLLIAAVAIGVAAVFYMTNAGRMKKERLRKATIAVFVLVMAVLAALHMILGDRGSVDARAPSDFVLEGDPPF